MTHQREVILEELSKFKGHPTADVLYERIKKKLPRISLATVYRNLEILSEAGMIRKLEISGRQKRFDRELEQHSHICCIRCRRVDNVRIDQRQIIPDRSEEVKGYLISGFRIEFFGICPECQKKIEPSEQTSAAETAVSCALSAGQQDILAALWTRGAACTSKEIAAAISLAPGEVSRELAELKEKGLVVSPARCKYQLAEAGKDVCNVNQNKEDAAS
jgi:Fe2+ or Zn2+ uptake regulation protein